MTPRMFMVVAIVMTMTAAVSAEEMSTVYGTVPSFSLTDQDGHSFSSESLHGKVWIADFIFTRCAGQCPMMTMQMGQIGRAHV